MPPIETRLILTLTDEGGFKVTQQRAYVYDSPLIQEDEWKDVCSISADYFFDRRSYDSSITTKIGENDG